MAPGVYLSVHDVYRDPKGFCDLEHLMRFGNCINGNSDGSFFARAEYCDIVRKKMAKPC
jgi:hypothetical protein